MSEVSQPIRDVDSVHKHFQNVANTLDTAEYNLTGAIYTVRILKSRPVRKLVVCVVRTSTLPMRKVVCGIRKKLLNSSGNPLCSCIQRIYACIAIGVIVPLVIAK
jgi:hypothetical protein